MRTLTAWAIAAAILGVAFEARAEAPDRSFGIGAFAGYAKAEDSDDGAALVGGSLSLRPFEVLGLLLEVGYRDEELDVGRAGGLVRDAEATFVPVLASAQLFPFGQRLDPLAPYVIAGGGAYFAEYELATDLFGERRTFRDREVELGWHVGAGLDVNLVGPLAVSGDIRWVDLDAELEDLDEEANADGVAITVGVKLFF